MTHNDYASTPVHHRLLPLTHGQEAPMAHNDQASSSRGGGGYSRPTNLNNKEAQPDPSPASSLFASCGLPPNRTSSFFPSCNQQSRQSSGSSPSRSQRSNRLPFYIAIPPGLQSKSSIPFFPDVFHRVDRFFSI
jgi:hypothetical protein